MRGLRVKPSNVDLDSFRVFMAAHGAEEVPALAESAELIRFTIGRHVGIVSRRKDGTLTFAGVARPMLERMQEAARAARNAKEGEAA